ncbi:hypothetical protein ACS0TY_020153 [Phlomoides rotata]
MDLRRSYRLCGRLLMRASLETGLGMVIRDDEERFLLGRCLVSQELMDVDEGEAWGVLEALCWVKELGFNRVIVEMDSKRVYNAIMVGSQGDYVFWDLICKVKELLRLNNLFSVSDVHRNVNQVTHEFARASREFESPHNWVKHPSFVDDLLN